MADRSTFSSMKLTVEGNLYDDPKQISKDGQTLCVVIRMPGNWQDSIAEGHFDIEVKFFGDQAQNVLDSWKKGDRVFVSGRMFGRWWGNEGEEIQTITVNPDYFGHSNRWHNTDQSKAEKSGGSTQRRRGNEEEAPSGRRRSSRRSTDYEDDGGADREAEGSRKPTGRRSSRASSRQSSPGRSVVTSHGDDDDDDEF